MCHRDKLKIVVLRMNLVGSIFNLLLKFDTYCGVFQITLQGDIRVTIYDHDDVFEALFSGTENEVIE